VVISARTPDQLAKVAREIEAAGRRALPEPKGSSLEEFTEGPMPASAAALGVAESRGTRPPAAA
jgi:hypothetical protein